MQRDRSVTRQAGVPAFRQATVDHGMVSRFNAWFWTGRCFETKTSLVRPPTHEPGNSNYIALPLPV